MVEFGDYQFYIWPRWQKGIELGARAFGRFGAGTNVNTPPGDIITFIGAHLWYNHTIELHAHASYGMQNGTVMLGGGTRINMLEFIEDPTRDAQIRGLHRGLLSGLLQNLMFFVCLDVDHFSFRPPENPGLTYELNTWRVMPGAGAQWFFYIKNGFAGRFYLETSFSYSNIGGSHYISPLVSLGAELL